MRHFEYTDLGTNAHKFWEINLEEKKLTVTYGRIGIKNPASKVFMIIVTIVLMAIFTLFITRTALGRAQRACEQDRTMTALMGINVDRTISMTFIIGSSLASVAGMMFVLYYGVIDFYIGFLAGIKAFTAAVLGGIGSLPGAMLGGLLIGLIETFWAGYVSLEYKDVAAFSVLIVVLIFFPTGFLGKPDIEKV